MNSTALTPEASVKPYKTLLLECLRLRTLGRRNLHRRMKLLLTIWDDPEFRADNGNLDDFKAADLLNQYVEDSPFEFLDLRQIFLCFPRAKMWRENSIHRLYAQWMAKRATSKERELTGAKRPASPQVRKQLEDNLQKAREELGRVKAQRVSEVDQLRARIAELEEENRRLRARIIELETRLNGRE